MVQLICEHELCLDCAEEVKVAEGVGPLDAKFRICCPIKVKSPSKSESRSASNSPVRTSPRKKQTEPSVPLLKHFANYDDQSSSDSQSDEDVLEMTKSLEESPPVKYAPFLAKPQLLKQRMMEIQQ